MVRRQEGIGISIHHLQSVQWFGMGCAKGKPVWAVSGNNGRLNFLNRFINIDSGDWISCAEGLMASLDAW